MRNEKTLSHAEPDAGTLGIGRSLFHGDVLSDQTRDFMGLFRLQSGDTLLHQVTAFHVEIKRALLRFDFSGGNHLGIGIMVQCLLKGKK